MSAGHKRCPLAVQCTNDSSIASKLSMCEREYLRDPFLKYFVSKIVKRSPLINRGYYVRAKAITTVVSSFIEQHQFNTQILSLGAGFDTTYFRLNKEGKLSSCKYFEVDYNEVICRKADILENIPEYNCFVQRKCYTTDGHEVIQIGPYVALGCDITNIRKLEHLLEINGIDPKLPTLLVAECVLSYIEPSKVDHLLIWCATFFQSAVFCTYEQINPSDKFGQVMMEHFVNRGSPLKGLRRYSDVESHKNRYIKAGWEKTSYCNMNQFYMSLPPSERLRVESLDLFDEFEEWHLKCNHYILMCSAVGQCVSYLNHLPFTQIHGQFLSGSSTNKLSISFISTIIGRYAHCSVQRCDGEVIIHGGFGCSDNGVHSRLNSMISVFFSDSELKLRNIELCGDKECQPGALMHHKAVLLPSGEMLMYGGRTSPKNANANFYLCSMLCVDKMLVKNVRLPTPIPARWRHTMTYVSIDGTSFVIIVGGRSDTSSALNDCYLLSVKESSLKMVSKFSMPEGLHSHCAALYNDGILIIGGLNSSMILQSTTLYLQPDFKDQEHNWKLSTIEFTPQLPPRYGSTSIVQDNIVWVVGGVSIDQEYEILMLDLIKQTWHGYVFDTPVSKEHPLLLNCTAHLHNGKELLIIGGGGNLFSFGTCINYLVTVVPIEKLS